MKLPMSLGFALLFSPFVTAQGDGWTLFQPTTSTTTTLVDDTGATVRSWPGTATPGLSCYLLPNGDLVRTQRLVAGLAGSGGGVERLSFDGTIEWQFQYFGATFQPHHDIEVLPNGNVLLIVYEFWTGTQAVDLGRNPATIGSAFAPDTIVEIQPTGLTTGTVVWEWHATDHLVQDFDAGKPGFGAIADRPDRIDVNFPAGTLPGSGDWLHVNGIDYNAELDQIVLSIPRFHEVWIIDHSTTTAEAAGSTGGDSGKGGDILYRWGNPLAYGRGLASDQRFFTIHDVTWIEAGRPGAGNLLVYNNGVTRPAGQYSSVDEWVTSIDASGNYPTPAVGVPHGPAALTWSYFDTVFYSPIMSGAERLANGNTLIIQALPGFLFEVTPGGSVVWSHSAGGAVFKARRYPTGIDPSTSFCDAADGSLASCPCSNPGLPHSGCDIQQSTGGVSLSIAAQETSPANRATFAATGFPATSTPTAIVIRAPGLDGAGPVAFGDGLRCVGAPVVRLGAAFAQGGFSTHTFGHGTGPGAGTFYYQLWFRNTPAMFCTADAFNLSNGRSLDW